MTQLTRAQVEQIAWDAGFFGANKDIISAIAQAESNFVTDARNHVNHPGSPADGSWDRGILQVNSYWHAEVPDSCCDDPACIFPIAWEKLSAQGTNFNSWNTFKNGEYKKFLQGVAPMQIKNGWIDSAFEIDYAANTWGPFVAPYPKYIVIHGTASPGATARDIANFFAKTQNTGNGVSVHCIIDKSGEVVQGLACDMTSFGSGTVEQVHAPWLPTDTTNSNMWCLDIEHCKYDGAANSDILTAAQQQSSFEVVKLLCDTYHIPYAIAALGDNMSNGGIIRHADIAPINRHNCPGPYPWQELKNFLQGSQPPVTMTPKQYASAKDLWQYHVDYPCFAGTPPRFDSGIALSWQRAYLENVYFGACNGIERRSTDGNGNPVLRQGCDNGWCEYGVNDGIARWYDIRGIVGVF